jgi:hypothetical protein
MSVGHRKNISENFTANLLWASLNVNYPAVCDTGFHQ